MHEVLREETWNSIGRLKKREQDVLRFRYALDGGERYTLKRISDEMGISPETVRQIEMRAIKKLRTDAEYLKQMMVN